MKKQLFAVLLLAAGLAGVSRVKAANMGPYGYDDSNGAQITSGLGIYQASSPTLYGIAPAYPGQMVECTSCTNGFGNQGAGFGTGKYNLCIASGTGSGAWVMVSSNTEQCR